MSRGSASPARRPGYADKLLRRLSNSVVAVALVVGLSVTVYALVWYRSTDADTLDDSAPLAYVGPGLLLFAVPAVALDCVAVAVGLIQCSWAHAVRLALATVGLVMALFPVAVFAALGLLDRVG